MFSLLLTLVTLVGLPRRFSSQSVINSADPVALRSDPQPGFNNFSRVYNHLKLEHPLLKYFAPVRETSFGPTVKINLTLTVLSISPIQSNPALLGVEMRIEEEWRDESVTWDKSLFGNISEVKAGGSFWVPALSYDGDLRSSDRTPSSHYRKKPASSFYSATSDGRFRGSYQDRMNALCENNDSDGTKHCSLSVSYTGNTLNINMFDKVELIVHPNLSRSKYRISSLRVIRASEPRFDKLTDFTRDEASLLLILKENDVLAFSEATWPMFCIATATIGLCWREGTSYELFSLRTGITIFCAVACMLSVDQQLHPRVANRPYLSWIVGFHVMMSGLVVTEKIYSALRNRFGLPDAKNLPFPGYVGRFLTALVVLIAVVII